jgi:hypothetical protein
LAASWPRSSSRSPNPERGRHRLHRPGHRLRGDRGGRGRRRRLALGPGRPAGQGGQEGTRAERVDDPEIRLQLRSYVNHLNFIATLRARRLLSDELVGELFHEAAKACWEQGAKSFVREIRATQNEDFARELQDWIGAPDP